MITKEKTNLMTYQRVVVTAHGGPDVLKIIEDNLPEPKTERFG